MGEQVRNFTKLSVKLTRPGDASFNTEELSLTLGAEVWSGPIPLICSGLFSASFVLVASRLQGGKFLAREWRQLV